MEKEKIAIIALERDGVVASTAVIEVNSFSWGYPSETFRWVTYCGHDKDQSPTGYGVQVYEPHPKFLGLFQRHEVLDHWDGPVSETIMKALMEVVCARLADGWPWGGGLKKKCVGEFLLRVLRATWPTEGERSNPSKKA